MTCVDPAVMVEQRIDRVLTQYRESPKLLFLLRTYLGEVAKLYNQTCDLPERFNLETATGHQLTLIGSRMGFPRSHCVCDVQPVFGFDCEGVVTLQPVAGFCDGQTTWEDCGDKGTGILSINNDELYRRMLKARARQFLKQYSLLDLEEAVIDLWGPTARVMDSGNGRVVVSPGRDLEDNEISVLQLYPRIMPVQLGVEVRFHFNNTRVFGFGEGWGGFCDGDAVDGEPILTENDEIILTEEDEPLLADNTGASSDWMCEIDVQPYDC